MLSLHSSPMSTDQISLRPAVADDADIIFQMISDLADYLQLEDHLESCPDDFRRHLSGNPPTLHGLIAERGGAPVGLSLFFPSFSSWRGAQGVYIQDLYVVPDLRAGGLGKRILIEVLRTAYALWGAEYLRLAVSESNMDGQGFYERLGMGWASDERIFAIDGADLVSLRESPGKLRRENDDG